MRACLLPLLLISMSAFAEGSDMQWQAPRILPPKGEAAAAASVPAAGAGAVPGKALPVSSAPAAAAGKPATGAAAATAKSASATPTAPASATGKSSTAPQLAAAIKEKLEATQAPAPKNPRGGERGSGSAFMTQQEFRSRLAAAAAVAKAQPLPPKVVNVTQSRKAPSPPPQPKLRPGYWSYGGEAGPEHWGDLSAEWARCGNGTRQSPIDIRDGFKLELEPPLFEYQPSLFSVLDNGHTIQVNINSPSFASVMGRRFKLQQFHFHRPSEEKIEGRGSEMVMHLVHKDDDGRLLVVAVLIDRGEPNTQVQTVWNNLPLEKNDSLTASSRLELEQLLPAKREYYTYMGSLTTPPCSEGVLWVVLKQPITLSAQQIALFSRLYPMNARPLQAAGERMIKESN
jgi:carbonic anhydrase